MSVNLGTEAVQAIYELRSEPQFARFVDAFGDYAQTQMMRSMGAENRVDATAYARAIYEIWVAIASAHTGKHQTQVKPPSMTRGKVVETTLAQ
jgi:hypothetical protein